MENTIQQFISIIEKGPFKCLQNCGGKTVSEYVVAQNQSVGDIFDCAVNQAWLDMCRTVSGAGNEKSKNKYSALKKAAAAALRSYFDGKPKTTVDAFDGWFGSVCSEIGSGVKLTVEQKQKILNMAFKYLYCCEDIRSKSEAHFACCHMPLDRYTLTWVKKNCVVAEYHGEAWSKLDGTMYFQIQNGIRKKLGVKNILQQEFSIWQEEKAMAETRDFKTSAKAFVRHEDCPEKLKNELKEYLDSLN